MKFPIWPALAFACLATPIAAQEQVACWSYADSALFVVSEATKFNCGFTGGRWSTDYNAHYAFCMAQGPDGGGIIDTETNQRHRDLTECWARGTGTQAFMPRTDFENTSRRFPLTLLNFCQNYADYTSQQVQYNLQLGCGNLEDGGRWAQSYNLHRDACVDTGFGGQNIGQVAASEIGARAWAIKECQVGLAVDQTPVPPPPPPPPPPAPGATHVIISDVDLYDAPGQNRIGILRAGEEVRATCGADGWCQVEGRGWAWSTFLRAK